MSRRDFFKKVLDYALLALIAVVVSSILGVFRAPKSHFKLSDIDSRVTLDGKRVSDILKNNKPTILHFWGTWCPICRQELSTIEDLSKQDGINIITVAVNSGTDDQLKEWLKSRGVDFIVINDISGILASKAGVNVFPSTIYYDSNKKLKFSDSGYTSYAGFLARIKLLK